MIFIIFIIILLIFGLSILLNSNLNSSLDIDLLNDFNLIKYIEEQRITNIKVFRKRENTYLKHNSEIKLVLLETDNDVIVPSFQFNTVQDISIVIIGKTEKGKSVVIKEYQYCDENRKKGIELNRFLYKHYLKN